MSRKDSAPESPDRRRRAPPVVVGVDLAGSVRRPTGVCALRGMTVTACATVHADEDELDAVTGALVGRLHLLGRAEALGDPAEGLLFLPAPRRAGGGA